MTNDELPHTLKELGERADDRGGWFYLQQHPAGDRDDDEERWEVAMGNPGDIQSASGKTPGEAVRRLIDMQEAGAARRT